MLSWPKRKWLRVLLKVTLPLWAIPWGIGVFRMRMLLAGLDGGTGVGGSLVEMGEPMSARRGLGQVSRILEPLRCMLGANVLCLLAALAWERRL